MVCSNHAELRFFSGLSYLYVHYFSAFRWLRIKRVSDKCSLGFFYYESKEIIKIAEVSRKLSTLYSSIFWHNFTSPLRKISWFSHFIYHSLTQYIGKLIRFSATHCIVVHVDYLQRTIMQKQSRWYL
jgi:hypothetical protein